MVDFGLNYTFPVGWVAGWLVGMVARENENRTKLSFTWVEAC